MAQRQRHLAAALLAGAVLLPLAIEYAHWTEARGEALIAFGAPLVESILRSQAGKRREFLRARRNAEGGLDLFGNQSSGVLTSVHAFAADPARGVFILIFLVLSGVFTFYLGGFYEYGFETPLGAVFDNCFRSAGGVHCGYFNRNRRNSASTAAVSLRCR